MAAPSAAKAAVAEIPKTTSLDTALTLISFSALTDAPDPI